MYRGSTATNATLARTTSGEYSPLLVWVKEFMSKLWVSAWLEFQEDWMQETLQLRPTVAQLCERITAFRPARARDWCAAATSMSVVQHDGTVAMATRMLRCRRQHALTRPRAIVVVQHDGNCAFAAYQFLGCQSASACARGSRSCARPPVSCSHRSARRLAALPTRNRPAAAGTRARQPGFSHACSSYRLHEAHSLPSFCTKQGCLTHPPTIAPYHRAATDTCMRGTWISPCALEAACARGLGGAVLDLHPLPISGWSRRGCGLVTKCEAVRRRQAAGRALGAGDLRSVERGGEVDGVLQWDGVYEHGSNGGGAPDASKSELHGMVAPRHFAKSPPTEDAGRGVRADTIEGKIDNHNYLKNVGQGDALQRKLLVAIAERDRQVAAFSEVIRTVEREVKREWRKKINEWLEDPLKSIPQVVINWAGDKDLYMTDCPMESQVRVEVHKDEDALTAGGKAPLHRRSATAFLVAGIQIEDAQRCIVAELKGTALVAADRESKIQEWCHALLVKITKFRTLQKIYMPGAAHTLEAAEGERNVDVPPPKVEAVKLFMPSKMTPDNNNDTLRGSVLGLVDMEAKLQVAQCENSLASLCSRLYAKHHLITFRNSNVTGQVQSTKARTLIEQVGERVNSYANRYRQGRAALVALKGAAAYLHLRELHSDDVWLDGDNRESDAAAWKKLAMMGAGRGACAPRNAPGMLKRVMSWIWTAPGALDEVTMHESIRVEWSRVLARKTRWCEEVMLLREEMRRVLRYLEWGDLTVAAAAGVRAYALKQAAWHDRLSEFFRTKWNVPAVTAAQHLLAQEGWDQLYALE
ncbi:hypothetical protein B0H14DRAFT_3173668 [Mycena olivaceomarginata]|nr:hypothetical protein B0H14DRAFT_3173668 [Mycena olivaceomarginata]